MAKSLNSVQLLGNAVRDPEMRTTPNGTAVCSFSLATNRSWTVNGEKKEETEFHRIVVWNKLAEIVGKYVTKGKRMYVEGRLTTKKYEKDGVEKTSTEIVAEDVILLDGGTK